MLDKLKDILLFRQPSEEDDFRDEPIVTIGSIVWGVLLRTIIVILLITILLESLTLRQYWWFMLFGIWIFAVYPAWKQWSLYHEKVEKFKENTLCGSCKYFDSTGRLCKIYDEHVSVNYIPCDGLNWEPTQFDD